MLSGSSSSPWSGSACPDESALVPHPLALLSFVSHDSRPASQDAGCSRRLTRKQECPAQSVLCTFEMSTGQKDSVSSNAVSPLIPGTSLSAVTSAALGAASAGRGPGSCPLEECERQYKLHTHFQDRHTSSHKALLHQRSHRKKIIYDTRICVLLLGTTILKKIIDHILTPMCV